MSYKIIPSITFSRCFKRLFKKYPSLKKDVAELSKELRKDPTMGDDLGDNTRKVRMAITSKNKGKRGGARIITYHILINEKQGKIYLLTIYDKGEQDNISAKEIAQLKCEIGLI